MNAAKLLVIALSTVPGSLAAQPVLPIEVRQGGAATRGAGVALYRELPAVEAGRELTLLGRYDEKEDRIAFLDPPWLHVTWPRRLHWRIYFFVETGPSRSRAVSQYLEKDEAERLQQLPAIKEYVKQVKKVGGRSSRAAAPKLSLHEVYAGKVPLQFAELDARATKVSVYCDNLGRDGRQIQQAFFARPQPLPKTIIAGDVAVLTATVHPNRPDLTYRQREEGKVHHFNLKVTKVRRMRVRLDQATAKRRFVAEIRKATMRLQDICTRHGLGFSFDAKQLPRVSWLDERMVVSGEITPRPEFSFKPVPYATASVFFNAESGMPERIVVVRRVHRDPPD